MTNVRVADLTSPADCQQIATYLAGQAGATPFHRPEWLRAIALGVGHRGHYLVYGDPVRGVLPLTEVHSLLFGSALVSSGFAVGGGIIADDSNGVEALANAAIMLAKRLSCSSVELRGGKLPEDWSLDGASYVGFSRDLQANDEAEMRAIPRKQRAEVRRAVANELTVDFGDGDAHYAVYAESVRNLGTPVFPRNLFGAVLDAFGPDADVLVVRKDGRPLAAVISLYHRGTVMPFWGGGLLAARQFRANDMMYFALMRHARNRGCTRFDFGRSKVGSGAAAFKANWGFKAVPLTYAWHGEGKRRSVNPLDPRYRRKVALWQKLPLRVANRLGPLIARGLG